jgi:fumarylacetoacetate (FAA) hydrolase
MKLVTFKTKEGTVHTGWLKAGGVVEMHKADKRLPNDMLAFIDNHESYFRIIKENRLEELIPHYQLIDVKLMAPLTNPRSIRDYLSFEQHMLNASKTFGHSIGEAYYDIPVFYFTNHNAVFGPQDEIKRPKNETKMDFELELAVVMGKKGSDIPEDETDDYIFGYTIFNDWTARSLQREEMTLPLGPAKCFWPLHCN